MREGSSSQQQYVSHQESTATSSLILWRILWSVMKIENKSLTPCSQYPILPGCTWTDFSVFFLFADYVHEFLFPHDAKLNICFTFLLPPFCLFHNISSTCDKI